MAKATRSSVGIMRAAPRGNVVFRGDVASARRVASHDQTKNGFRSPRRNPAQLDAVSQEAKPPPVRNAVLRRKEAWLRVNTPILAHRYPPGRHRLMPETGSFSARPIRSGENAATR